MKLIWHITKKDLKRLALPLVAFVLAIAAKIALGLTLRAGNGADGSWFTGVQLYLNLCLGLEALVAYVLVGLLVHEDAVVGTQVFWRTRPIRGGMLLKSKLLTCALVFGVLPVLLALSWWLVCGYGWAQMGPAALEVLAAQAEIVLPAFALAVLADNLGRYLSVTLIAAALAAFTSIMATAYLPPPESQTWRLMQTKSILMLALAVTGMAVVVVRQFRARSLGISYAIWTGMMIALPLVLWSWPFDIFAPLRGKSADSSERTRVIAVTSTGARIDYVEDRDAYGTARSLEVGLRAEGAPTDLVLTPVIVDLTWQARSGPLHAAGGGADYFDYFNHNRVETVQELLGLAKPVVDDETDRWTKAWLEERHARMTEEQRAEMKRLQGQRLSPEESRKRLSLSFPMRGVARFEPPTVKTAPEITTEFVLARPRQLMELPLQSSGWILRQGCGVRIAQVRVATSTSKNIGRAALMHDIRKIDLVVTQSQGTWAAPHWDLFQLGLPQALAPDCWLLNRELGRADWKGPTGSNGLRVRIDGVQVSWRTVSVEEPQAIRNGRWTSYIPDWDKKITLAVFAYQWEDEFRRTMTLEQIKDVRPHVK